MPKSTHITFPRRETEFSGVPAYTPVLMVWKLDRLGRSLPHLLTIINSLHDRKVGFRSLTEGMETATASGELLFHVR